MEGEEAGSEDDMVSTGINGVKVGVSCWWGCCSWLAALESAHSGRDPAGTGLDWSDLPAERLAGRRGGGIGRGGGHWRCWLGYEGIRGTGVKYEWCEMFFPLGGGILL